MGKIHDLLDKLCCGAAASVMLDSTVRGPVSFYIRNNLPIPDRLLPGRFVMRQSKETRDLLKTLTSDQAAKMRVSHILEVTHE
jgi:hypothetical protein